jgi:hypothetical protein
MDKQNITRTPGRRRHAAPNRAALVYAAITLILGTARCSQGRPGTGDATPVPSQQRRDTRPNDPPPRDEPAQPGRTPPPGPSDAQGTPDAPPSPALPSPASPSRLAETVTLDNGVRILLYPIADSRSIAIVTFIPYGITGDDPGCAMWCGLLRGLVSASTGPAPHDEQNAMTMSNWTTFIYSRHAAAWSEGVEAHARWLGIERFGVNDTVARRKEALETIRAEAGRGQTSRLATAAWVQALRAGDREVGILASLERARPAELGPYYQRKRSERGPPILVVSGLFHRDELVAAIREKIGGMTFARAAAPRQAETVPTRIVWDMPTAHLILYWPLPELSETARAYVLGVERSLNGSLSRLSASDYLDQRSVAYVEGGVRLGGRGYFVANIPLRDADGKTVEAARGVIQDLIGEVVSDMPGRRAIGRAGVVTAFEQLARPAAVLAEAEGRGIPRRLVEGNLAIMLGQFELACDGKFEQYAAVLRDEEQPGAVAELAKALHETSRKELVIAPRPAPAAPPRESAPVPDTPPVPTSEPPAEKRDAPGT